jgi:hypothetical protein
MRTLKPLKLLAFALAIAFAGLPGLASALYSYEGSDYSYDFNNIRQVAICDGETDGHQAYVNYTVTGQSQILRVNDENGSVAGCASSGIYTRIYRHHACEVLDGPDACGPYVYP